MTTNPTMTRRFFDVERQETVTEQELAWEFSWLRASHQTETETFGEYIANCLGKNGTLIEIYKTL